MAPYEEYPLSQLIKRTAARIPDKVAIIDGDNEYTFRQIDEHSDRFASALAGLGISKGDRVGILAQVGGEGQLTAVRALKVPCPNDRTQFPSRSNTCTGCSSLRVST
ncbi:MAG: AMP-binding protein [Chloroflexi bacterium]|nr:AMP-binding protein [Chloroflexota bacterium]